MLSKHLILCVYLHIVIGFGCSSCLDVNKFANTTSTILKNVNKITDTLLEVTPYINITISAVPPNCVQMVCKFVCFNGKSSEIDRDIETVAAMNNFNCNRIEELRLYSYEFPNNKLYQGFLGNYSNRVESLYLASSNISDVDTGTFANGIFQRIYFENLKLTQLRKDFFEGVTIEFHLLSVIQKEDPLKWVNGDFLDHVKYQIKYLTMQVGLSCIRNLTGSDSLLNTMIHIDFSYNHFHTRLTDNVFNKLSMVEHMDLSHSNIDYLPPYVFAEFTSTLEYLDLSYNNLKTLSRTIFGWREIPRDLKIYANDNDWFCTCELQAEMKAIFIYQTTKLSCRGPEKYENASLFDDAICDSSMASPIGVETTKALEVTTTHYKEVENSTKIPTPASPEYVRPNRPMTTEVNALDVTTHSSFGPPSSLSRPDLVELRCCVGVRHEASENFPHSSKAPLFEFDLWPRDQLRVEVVIEEPSLNSFEESSSSSSQNLNDSYGLVWFSKVTAQYHKMEINYNEYGLGCYNSISYVTMVDELIPNMAYTFCFVSKDQLKISPFNCKSIHISSNLSIRYSAWLTRDMKVTGLSLVVFGIIMFSFAGILMIYVLFKRKPILLKGSKRVTMLGKNCEDIVVMPREKSIKAMKEKENKLAHKSSLTCLEQRRGSTDSSASYQSYINANLYEIIPAYIKIQSKSDDTSSTTSTANSQQLSPAELEKIEADCSYFTPLSTVSSSADLVNYAEIPYRSKRVSSDPLPEVPADQTPYYGPSLEKFSNRDIGVIYMLDSQV